MCRTVFPAAGGAVAVTTISAMHSVDVCHSAVATGVSVVGAEHDGTGAVMGAARWGPLGSEVCREVWTRCVVVRVIGGPL